MRELAVLERREVRQADNLSVKIISPFLTSFVSQSVVSSISLSSPLQLHLFSLTDTEVEIINCEIFKTILLRAEVAEHQFVYFKRFMQLSSNKDGVESFPANFSFAVEYISSSCKIFFVVKHVQFLL